MAHDAERTDRASNYIFGRMSEAERERAERDLEFDPTFRDAVMQLAERMRLFDRQTGPHDTTAHWDAVASRLAELPQMRARQQADNAAGLSRHPSASSPFGMAVSTLRGRRALVTAVGLCAAFALGYIAGRF